MLSLLKPNRNDVPGRHNFYIECFTNEELFEDLQNLVNECSVVRITLSYSPVNAFTGHAVCRYGLSSEFIKKYNLKIEK